MPNIAKSCILNRHYSLRAFMFGFSVCLLGTVSGCDSKQTIEAESPELLSTNPTKVTASTQHPTQKPLHEENLVSNHNTAKRYNNHPANSSLQPCTQLKEAMLNVNNNSQISTIHDIQSQLDSCLPYADNKTVLELLTEYQLMYQRFLKLDYDDYEAFNDFMFAFEDEGPVPDPILQSVNPRILYLIDLYQAGEDVRPKYLGEGYFELDHDLMAMARLFTPYLNPDQKQFVLQMAKDNQEIFWNDAAIDISFKELVDRAVFWEDYLKRYPNGYGTKDAEQLLNFYRRALFYGSDNTQWTDDTLHIFYNPKHKQIMQKLSRRSNSTLAKDAKDLLNFMALSDEQRQANYPVNTVVEEGNSFQAISIANEQFDQAMSIPPYTPPRQYRECFTGVVCYPYPDISKLEVSPTFAKVCPTSGIGEMLVDEDLVVWSYDFSLRDKDQFCEKVNLKDYAELECEFSLDWKNNPSLSLFKEAGGITRVVYETADKCGQALTDRSESIKDS